jgi:hypothetical protein
MAKVAILPKILVCFGGWLGCDRCDFGEGTVAANFAKR